MRSLVRVQDGPLRGGLAQLVERLLCKQDVSGSSPLTSTERGFSTVCTDLMSYVCSLLGESLAKDLENYIVREV